MHILIYSPNKDYKYWKNKNIIREVCCAWHTNIYSIYKSDINHAN